MRHLCQCVLSHNHDRIFTEAPLMMTRVPPVSSSCDKCGTITKSGELSCCARGGSWFKKCADAVGPKFDHTWAEGVQICKDFASLISVTSPLQFTFRQMGVIPHALDVTQPRSTAQQQTVTYGFDSVPIADTADSNYCFGLTKMVVCMCTWSIISCLKTYFFFLRTH